MSSNPIGFEGGLTVLIAIYFKCDPALFDRALQSLYANTLLPDEVLISVDGPVPESVNKVLARYVQAHGTRVLRLPVNAGLATALNQGLRHVSTVWVARADQDDINLPHRFARLALCVSRMPAVDIVGGNILEVDDDGRPIAERRVPETHDDIVRYARTRNPFNHMTVVFRRDSVLAAGGYPLGVMQQDYGLWAAMLSRGCIAANVQDVLVHATAGRDMYRRRGGVRNARSELELQRLLVHCGLKSYTSAFFQGLLRAMVFVLPNWMRGLIYERLLRSRPPRAKLF